jgi:hypothetical protein
MSEGAYLVNGHRLPSLKLESGWIEVLDLGLGAGDADRGLLELRMPPSSSCGMALLARDGVALQHRREVPFHMYFGFP